MGAGMNGWLPDVLGALGLLAAVFASYKYGYERGRRVQVQSDIKALGPVEKRVGQLRTDLDAALKAAGAGPRDPPSGPRSKLQ